MEKDIRTIKNLLLILVIIVLAYLLKLLSFLFIPLALALFITLLIMPLLQWFERKKVPYWAGLSIIFVAGFGVLKGIGEIVQHTGKRIIERQEAIAGQFNQKLAPLIERAESWLGVGFFQNENGLLQEGLEKIASSATFTGMTGNALEMAGGLVSALLMVLVFLILMLYGARHIERYVLYVGGDSKQNNLTTTFHTVKNSLSTFIKVKVLISLATGIFFGVITWLFGVDFPLFWGFMAFVLNFVQAIGSVVITIIVVLFGFLQIESPGLFGLYAVLLASTQILWGSILEPVFMGKSFSINTVFIIIGLMLWGYLWGIAGLVLAIPLLVLIKTILASSPDMQFLARLMERSSKNK